MTGRRPAACLLLLLLPVVACGPPEFRFRGLTSARPHPLNAPLILEFSEPVQEQSVHDGTLRIVSGVDGTLAGGRFEVTGRRVTFHPRVPTRADLSDAGLHPGTAYQIEVAGLPRVASLRSRSGRRLTRGARLDLVTASVRTGAGPGRDLFQDLWPGEPRLADGHRARLVLPGQSVDLVFTEPLDPRAVAQADLRLRGPWSTDTDRESNPRLTAELVENQEQARLRLTLPAQLPAPLTAGEGAFEIDVAQGALWDLGGNRFREGPRINMEVLLEDGAGTSLDGSKAEGRRGP